MKQALTDLMSEWKFACKSVVPTFCDLHHIVEAAMVHILLLLLHNARDQKHFLAALK